MMESTISVEVRARIDAHLDAVETQLTATGVPREKRRGIIDDLETHILEMIGSSAHQPSTVAEVDELLSRLDRPEAYGKEESPAQPLPVAEEIVQKPAFCPRVRQGMVWILLGILAQAFGILGMLAQHVEMTPTATAPPVNSGPPVTILILFVVIAVLAVVAPIIGTALGWIAVEQIRKSGGKLYGLALATFEALLYPILVASGLALMIWYWIVIAYYNGSEIPPRGIAIWLIGGTCTALVFGWILVWLLTRFSRSGVGDGSAMAGRSQPEV